jgi:general secretion pathway protein H
MKRVAARQSGFTLIEILVVVLVVSILMGVVVSSFSGVDREQALRGYCERLALKIEFARDKALQANREWGVYIDADGVRFAEFDEINGEWIQRAEKPFTPDAYDTALRFTVELAEIPGALSSGAEQLNGDDEDLPNIVLFSSGETTPFEISIEPEEWETTPWLLHSDGFTRTVVERGDEV